MVFDLDSLFVATVASTFSLAVLAALVAWQQRISIPSRYTLSLFFAAFAVSELDSLVRVLSQTTPQSIRDGLELLGFVANCCIGPLFLLYVRTLTGLSQAGQSAANWRHFVLPVLAGVFAICAMLLPASVRDIWYTGMPSNAPGLSLIFLQTGFTALSLMLVVQWLIYVFWVVQTQGRHLRRLEQHYSSTEGMELRWVLVIASALGLYVFQHMIGEILLVLDTRDPVGRSFDSFLVLVVVAALALWGLRPTPELDAAAVELRESSSPPDRKYEKSALGQEQLERIARKLISAMEVDYLYRDPNLNLSALAGHIGVSLNYASQTLNQYHGQSFFEFVNDRRIREAIPLIEAGEMTVLAIAYEVGFNSRSSFYSAFKRVTGMTPTGYKKTCNGAPVATGSGARAGVQ